MNYTDSNRRKDKGNFIVRYLKSLGHAISGIIYSLRYEHNMIIILLAMITTCVLGIFFNIKNYEWLFCISMFGSVAAFELINTAIEATIDLVTLKENPLAKIAKDTASSATLVLSVTAFCGAMIIFLPKIMEVL